MHTIERSRSRREWADHLIEVLERDDTSQHFAASSLLHLFVEASHASALEALLVDRMAPRWAEPERGPYAARYVRKNLCKAMLSLKMPVRAKTLAGLRGFLGETHHMSFMTMEHFTDQLHDLLELARNSGFHQEGEAILASCELSVTALVLTESGWFTFGDETAVVALDLRGLLYRRWVDAGRLEEVAWRTLDFEESRALLFSGDVDVDRLQRSLPEHGPHADAVLEGRPDLRAMALQALSLPLSLLRAYPEEVLRPILQEVVRGIRPNGRFDHFSREDSDRLYNAAELLVGFHSAAADLDSLLAEVEPLPVRAVVAAARARVSPLADFDALRAELVEVIHGFWSSPWTRPLCRWAARQSDARVRFEGLSKLLEVDVSKEDPEIFRVACDEPLARTMALGGLTAQGDRAASRELVRLAKEGEVVQRALALRALRLSARLPPEYLALAHAALADHETVNDCCMPAVREGALSLSKRPGLDEAATLTTLTNAALQASSCSNTAFETSIASWTGLLRRETRCFSDGRYDYVRASR